MPKGQWTPPDAGEDAPAEVKKILKEAYSAYRDEHPAENPAVKAKGAKIAWGAVKNAGWHKNAEGKWVKMKKKEMSEIVIDAFKSGDYPQGKFSTKELTEIQSTYNPENYEAPILIGHLSDPAYKGNSTVPAFGWIGKVKIVGDHLKFVASQFTEQLKKLIKGGFYKKVSVAFFQPDDPNNPTPGKWHLHHLAFLGGAIPAVKGLEQLAFAQIIGVGIEFAEVDAEVSVDGEIIGEVEDMGDEDTLKDMAEYCGNFLKKIEDTLSADIDDETRKQRINLAAYDLQSELTACVNSHFAFVDKLGKMEEHEGTEMSEKKNWLALMAGKVQSIINHRKESNMDAKKEQEYQEKIVALDTQVKQFAEEKRLADEAKAKAEKDAVDQAARAAEEARVTEIKAFCDLAIKEGKMTPAIREKDEPIMVNLAKISADALKSFQEKYAIPVVPLGTVLGLDGKQETAPNDNRAQVIKDAEKYVTEHAKEFAGLDSQTAVARAHYLYATGQIKLTSAS